MKIHAMYWSATGTTEKVVRAIAQAIAGQEKIAIHDFTLPQAREQSIVFAESDAVIFGTPVYAGRVPNVLLKYLATVQGNGALAVPVVLFGNRDYDDAHNTLTVTLVLGDEFSVQMNSRNFFLPSFRSSLYRSCSVM